MGPVLVSSYVVVFDVFESGDHGRRWGWGWYIYLAGIESGLSSSLRRQIEGRFRWKELLLHQ